MTEIKKFLLQIREREGEKQLHMADRLGVTRTLLSFVELGHRNMSEQLFNNIVKEYKLSEEEAEEMKLAELASRELMYINMKDLNKEKRKFLASLYVNIDKLPTTKVRKMKEILEEE